MCAYSAKGVVGGQGQVTISGAGGPCKNFDDVACRMGWGCLDQYCKITSAHYTAEISREIDG
ncbi:hypothetical protein COMA1_10582 [Candidatus Nitrospira nitrosa]|uniref:Uncharacterized protein n=1 Tax=Candidatus Nitrospira nitrosa TaxID=1742972 RepID=A0A0S4L415_9BACT|nr:hypothetical protein COMA1_10582 [Candidatus Nitrospira nitrosa]